MSWSPDSKFIYIDIPGADARILRIRAFDGHQETALDLRAQEGFNLIYNNDLGFSIAPDGSVIFNRPNLYGEIYAYDLRDK